MSQRLLVAAVAALLFTATLGAIAAQEKSVRPGVNDTFQSPNLKEWVTKFEGENRENFAKRKEIVAACKVEPGMTVADVGAGTGLFTRLFSSAVGEKGTVYANDLSPKFLEHIAARAKEMKLANVKTVLGQPADARLPEGTVDLAFVCDVYHHFEYPHKMLGSILKSLKPGGRLIVIDFVRDASTRDPWILRHVRAGQDVVEKEILGAGFQKADEIKGLLRESYMIVFQKPAAEAK